MINCPIPCLVIASYIFPEVWICQDLPMPPNQLEVVVDVLPGSVLMKIPCPAGW